MGMRLTVLLSVLIVPPLLAHPGRTDKYGCHGGKIDRHCNHGSSTPPSYYEPPKPKPLPRKPDYRFPVDIFIKVLIAVVVGLLTSMLFTRKHQKPKPKRTIFRRLFNKTKYWLLRSIKRYFK